MSSAPSRPGQICTRLWDVKNQTPVFDREKDDPRSGEDQEISKDEDEGYPVSPPDVDITITNLHGESFGMFRAQRNFPFEKLLSNIMKVVEEKKIRIHSLNATTWSITIVLADDLCKKGGFQKVACEMANGLLEDWCYRLNGQERDTTSDSTTRSAKE